MKETFGIGEIKVEKKDCRIARFDISTVSFIYNEMRNGASEKTKEFFKQVWEACKKYRYGRVEVKLETKFKLIVPRIVECNLNFFERAARKLYQLKFTDLLFKQWNSIEELIEEFDKLKSDFDSIPVDFRLRVFSQNDFELLKNSLECIKLFPIDSSSINFFVELEYFITFKCFIFAFDFCFNLTEDSISFERTFENIESIHNSFEEIRSSFSSKGIPLPPLNYSLIESNTNNSFSLKTLIDNFPFFITIPSVKFIICDKLKIFLNKFQYFYFELGFFDNISRFKSLSYITELENLLTDSNNDEMEKMLLNEKYKVFGKLCITDLTIVSKMPIEEKRKLLEYLKNFLKIYN